MRRAPRLGRSRGEAIDTGQLVEMTWLRTPEDVTFTLACPPNEWVGGTHPDVSPSRRRTRAIRESMGARARFMDLPDARRLAAGGRPVARLMERRWERGPVSRLDRLLNQSLFSLSSHDQRDRV
jgi:hypothetical protein